MTTPARSTRMALVAALLLCSAALAAPAPWYYWRSHINGTRICAQTSPGPGWTQDEGPFADAGCQTRPRQSIRR